MFEVTSRYINGPAWERMFFKTKNQALVYMKDQKARFKDSGYKCQGNLKYGEYYIYLPKYKFQGFFVTLSKEA